MVPADGGIIVGDAGGAGGRADRGKRSVPEDPETLPDGETALGDRTNLVFQNTQVTRGTDDIRGDRDRQRDRDGPDRRHGDGHQAEQVAAAIELDGMTKVFGLLAFVAVAIIAIFGLVRGQDTTTLLLLCISTAIASIPTGLPTFVQAMLSSGAQRLAEPRRWSSRCRTWRPWAGPRSSTRDKTGTLTMNAMTATTMLAGGDWFKIEGPGYEGRRDPRRGRRRAPGLPQPGPGPGAVHRCHRR